MQLKRLSIKTFAVKGGGGVSSADRGVALFGTKTSDFSKFMVCLHRQEDCDSADKEEGVNFSRICADVFYR